MKRNYQTTFGDDFKRPSDSFGGSLLKGNPKRARPLDSKLPIHLVLKAEKSLLRLPLTFGKVNQAVVDICVRHGVTLYKYANVGNHLHLLIRMSHRRRWAAFIRELCGRVAQVALGLSGQAKAGGKFWLYRPYTRIVRGQWVKKQRRHLPDDAFPLEPNSLESLGLNYLFSTLASTCKPWF